MIHTSKTKSTEIKNGKWKAFNKFAVLISEGVYVNNKKHGLWREYYDHTGSLMIEEIYNNGIQHGRYACFHPNGQVMSEGLFDNGSREGYFRVYDESGNLVRTLLFRNNNQIEDIDETQLHHATTRTEAS
jgi:antitoxin component YwqK of YwqJK toxin-antitoxin module